MKASFLVSVCMLNFCFLQAQNPKIYINLATHNELLNENYDTDESEYNTAKSVALQILDHVNTLDARWNFQSCSKFVLGALNWDDAANSSSDLLETMYLSGKVELDPRNKTEFPDYMYNISDVYHLLDSCGVSSTHTVGGFLAYPYENEDWTNFRNPKIGAVYGIPWQAEIIWGGGSQNHVQDANNYGVWKPKDGDSETNFYTHDPSANLWLVGNGCAPVISDTTTNVQWIVNLMRNNIQRIEDGIWPQDKFYSLTVMINVRDFDLPGFYTKVETVLDSIQVFVNQGKMEWATITEKLNAFQNWSVANSLAYSQWSCEEATSETPSLVLENLVLFPNPARDEIYLENLSQVVSFEIVNTLGKIVNFGELNPAKSNRISLENLNPGIYFVRIEDHTFKILKE